MSALISPLRNVAMFQAALTVRIILGLNPTVFRATLETSTPTRGRRTNFGGRVDVRAISAESVPDQKNLLSPGDARPRVILPTPSKRRGGSYRAEFQNQFLVSLLAR